MESFNLQPIGCLRPFHLKMSTGIAKSVTFYCDVSCLCEELQVFLSHHAKNINITRTDTTQKLER